MNKKSPAKKKIITALCVTGGILLLIASFFLRDLLLRAGVVEYDSREVIQVKNKYSASLDAIVTEGKEKDFVITSKHGGLFEKSVITADGDSKSVYERLKNNVDVLCHSYCYTIISEKGVVTITFNQSGTKKLIYSEAKPEKKSEKDILSDLKENWYYYEEVKE
ncbi:MAG: hypothetical protein IJZ51_07985 [Ruminiclostridium sp.]|nr:hypothetical protein [Ruminiclostridium sp.]